MDKKCTCHSAYAGFPITPCEIHGIGIGVRSGSWPSPQGELEYVPEVFSKDYALGFTAGVKAALRLQGAK